MEPESEPESEPEMEPESEPEMEPDIEINFVDTIENIRVEDYEYNQIALPNPNNEIYNIINSVFPEIENKGNAIAQELSDYWYIDIYINNEFKRFKPTSNAVNSDDSYYIYIKTDPEFTPNNDFTDMYKISFYTTRTVPESESEPESEPEMEPESEPESEPEHEPESEDDGDIPGTIYQYPPSPVIYTNSSNDGSTETYQGTISGQSYGNGNYDISMFSYLGTELIHDNYSNSSGGQNIGRLLDKNTNDKIKIRHHNINVYFDFPEIVVIKQIQIHHNNKCNYCKVTIYNPSDMSLSDYAGDVIYNDTITTIYDGDQVVYLDINSNDIPTYLVQLQLFRADDNGVELNDDDQSEVDIEISEIEFYVTDNITEKGQENDGDISGTIYQYPPSPVIYTNSSNDGSTETYQGTISGQSYGNGNYDISMFSYLGTELIHDNYSNSSGGQNIGRLLDKNTNDKIKIRHHNINVYFDFPEIVVIKQIQIHHNNKCNYCKVTIYNPSDMSLSDYAGDVIYNDTITTIYDGDQVVYLDINSNDIPTYLVQLQLFRADDNGVELNDDDQSEVDIEISEIEFYVTDNITEKGQETNGDGQENDGDIQGTI